LKTFTASLERWFAELNTSRCAIWEGLSIPRIVPKTHKRRKDMSSTKAMTMVSLLARRTPTNTRHLISRKDMWGIGQGDRIPFLPVHPGYPVKGSLRRLYQKGSFNHLAIHVRLGKLYTEIRDSVLCMGGCGLKTEDAKKGSDDAKWRPTKRT
jgi:hypothetical protein